MSETDRRLKDHLNTNQVKRERMCLEILLVQDGYSEIKPRLPKGGPDGARDIQGLYKGNLCYAAVGFVNDATDTDQHRKEICKKFKTDLQNAIDSCSSQNFSLGAFVFLTNVGLTPTIVQELQKIAYNKGIQYCDIFDRERLRIVLDSSKGYAIRFRNLDIALSDAEQKDFFNTWSEQINSAIGSGFKGIDEATKRIQFLLEAQLPLDHLGTVIKLDSTIWEACKGEFFFQAMLSLRVHSEGLLGFVFGGASKEIVENGDVIQNKNYGPKSTQIGFGYSHMIPNTPQYSRIFGTEQKYEEPKNIDTDKASRYCRTVRSSGILEMSQKSLAFNPISAPFLDRFYPTCKLLELDNCMILFDCNKDLAEHIQEIKIYGGGYELLSLKKEDFQLETGSYERLKMPQEAKQNMNSHEWVTLRPTILSSCFHIDLMDRTPLRYNW